MTFNYIKRQKNPQILEINVVINYFGNVKIRQKVTVSLKCIIFARRSKFLGYSSPVFYDWKVPLCLLRVINIVL